jgi:hypothetical protein
MCNLPSDRPASSHSPAPADDHALAVERARYIREVLAPHLAPHPQASADGLDLLVEVIAPADEEGSV